MLCLWLIDSFKILKTESIKFDNFLFYSFFKYSWSMLIIVVAGLDYA